MIVPDNIRKCVVFVGYKMADETMRYAGSGFFLGKDSGDGKAANVFLVTAKHVIDKIRNFGLDEIYIRANTVNGESTWSKCQSNDWLFHPSDSTVDVALIPVVIPKDMDHLIFPLSLCVTDELLKNNAVGLGDEIFMVGLFHHHHGTKKNIPIVRVGNLAAMDEDKVSTKDFGDIDAYLIEARSIGGLSGSPVFLNLGLVRYIDNEPKYMLNGPQFFLLGLIHGHYDVPISKIDICEQDLNNPLSAEKVNTGIAIVVPIHKIQEAINVYNESLPSKSPIPSPSPE